MLESGQEISKEKALEIQNAGVFSVKVSLPDSEDVVAVVGNQFVNITTHVDMTEEEADELGLGEGVYYPVGITALYGPSGAGKTTLLNMVAGLVVPDEGRIVHNGTVFFDAAERVFLPARRRGVGYVFQEHRLFPHLSVRNNLLFAPRFCGLRAAGFEMFADRT